MNKGTLNNSDSKAMNEVFMIIDEENIIYKSNMGNEEEKLNDSLDVEYKE
jgi:hypothetical protein